MTGVQPNLPNAAQLYLWVESNSARVLGVGVTIDEAFLDARRRWPDLPGPPQGGPGPAGYPVSCILSGWPAPVADPSGVVRAANPVPAVVHGLWQAYRPTGQVVDALPNAKVEVSKTEAPAAQGEAPKNGARAESKAG
jgi:hypothetical protein